MLEIVSKVLSAIVIIVVIAIVASVSATVLITLKNSTEADKLLHSGDRRKRWFVYELLRTSYRSSHVMRGLLLPYNPAVASDGTVNVETLLVTRSGILVISTLRVSGYIDNPAHNDWIQYSNGRITRLRNPIELNESNARAIRNILRAEGISNVRVHNIIVYLAPGTEFKYRSDSVIYCENLLQYIRDLTKVSFITFRDMPNVLNAIRKYRIAVRRPQNRNVSGSDGSGNFGGYLG
nr:NERD domain-containing protein [Clostridia bacterium]